MEQAVVRNCKGARWNELLLRLADDQDVFHTTAEDDLPDEGFDLGTTRGLQLALDRLGFDPGKIDGLPGRNTSAAVLAYQTSQGDALAHDGVYGPNTRAALAISLTTAA